MHEGVVVSREARRGGDKVWYTEAVPASGCWWNNWSEGQAQQERGAYVQSASQPMPVVQSPVLWKPSSWRVCSQGPSTQHTATHSLMLLLSHPTAPPTHLADGPQGGAAGGRRIDEESKGAQGDVDHSHMGPGGDVGGLQAAMGGVEHHTHGDQERTRIHVHTCEW